MEELEKTIDKETEAYSVFSDYIIEIGVISAHKKRKEEKVKVDITNAMLMCIHENGSPLKKIPSRPVLKMTIDYARKELFPGVIDACTKGIFLNGWDKEKVIKELNKMCIRMENYARDIIYLNDGRLKPNKPSTVKAKGYNHPLFQTSQLARSITCRLIHR